MKLMSMGFRPMQWNAPVQTAVRQEAPAGVMAADTVTFSGKKKVQIPDMSKIVFDLMEKTLNKEVEWLGSGELSDPSDKDYGVNGVMTVLPDGRELHLGGSFLDYWSGEGLVMGIREPGKKKLKQYDVAEDALSELSELVSKVLTLDGWRARGSEDDPEEIEQIRAELEEFRPRFQA